MRSGNASTRVERLTKSFGSRRVFESFSLSVSAGERVGLVGANGSGKTTLLRCIAGSVTPDEGRVVVCGHVAGTLEAKRCIGISLAQDRSFYMRLSGYQNLIFFARLRGSRRDASAAVDKVVHELGLDDIVSRRMDACSTGMVQRLAFARALLGNPRVLLLDEATRSLDDKATGLLWEALERRPDTSVLLATHIHDDVAHLTRVITLDG